MTQIHIPDAMDPELIADPYGGYGRLREQAPMVRGSFMGQLDVWYATRFEEANAVLTDHRFVNDPASVPGAPAGNPIERIIETYGFDHEEARFLADSILTTDPPDHPRLRRLVSRAFTVRRVDGLRQRVEAITETLLDGLANEQGPVVELVERFCYPLPITVICELVGIPEADRPAWREWGRALVSMRPDVMPPALREMVASVESLIGVRRAEPVDDLLSALIRTHDEHGDQLSDRELVTFVITLVLAGHETTAHLLGNSVVDLLAHPDQLALLRERPQRWPGAVHELVRRNGIALLASPRYASTELELGGVSLRAGEAVVPVLVAANFDPRRYVDPDRLDVTRQPPGHGEGHLGFGHGAHYCLGAALARQEAEVALRALFGRFPELTLAVPEPIWLPLPGSRRLAELPVRLR
jgi:cytochrome P450